LLRRLDEEQAMSEKNGAHESEGQQVKEVSRKSKRGFASMRPERVRELSRLGGLAAHREGKAHEFTREEAREAGRKGGLATQARNREAGGQSGS
jgi:general stress protein YciG